MPAKNGLVLIDKPKGPTSNQISAWTRQTLGTKTGHVGTLDPGVSGVLPILFGKGIKLLEYMQEHDKEYVCLMKTNKNVPKEELEKTFKEFTGKIYQRPPEQSAVAKNIRVRTVYNIKILETKPKLVLFWVECEHGTYIRKLIEDIGLALGVKARMAELRRTRAGPFTEKECVSMTRLKDAVEMNDVKALDKILLPLETAVIDFPKIYVKNTAEKNLRNGADLMAPGIDKLEGHFKKDSPVAVMSEERKLVAVGIALISSDEAKAQKNGAVAKTKKVF